MAARQHAADGQVGLLFDRPDRRRGYRVDPGFQTRFRTTLLAFAVLIMLAVALLAFAVRFVVDHPAALPTSIWVPLGLFGLAVAIVALSFHLADRISHRYCGPVRRISATLEAARRGERPRSVQLRRNDEFHELAETVNATLRSLGVLGD
ncbi:MAG TPA: hypothetical protein VKB65_10505 [Myxococcota bacterium]|nr:hypothetical protein [Myxococcota bacterium]